jgi:transcriptional regulator with XRE-family HTH domain
MHPPDQRGQASVAEITGDPKIAARLRSARIRAGYTSAAKFARKHGFNVTTYTHHERGRRTITVESLQQYSSALDAGLADLLYDIGERSIITVSVNYTIVAGGKVMEGAVQGLSREADGIGGIPQVDVPNLQTLTAAKVSGNSMFPRYHDGDLIFYNPVETTGFIDPTLSGVECVVALADGEILVRTPVLQGDGRYTLIAHGAPPTTDQILLGASAIVAIVRPTRRRVM